VFGPHHALLAVPVFCHRKSSKRLSRVYKEPREKANLMPEYSLLGFTLAIASIVALLLATTKSSRGERQDVICVKTASVRAWWSDDSPCCPGVNEDANASFMA
jgi:hypothetical protein